MRRLGHDCIGLVAAILLATSVLADELPPDHVVVQVRLDSGFVQNQTPERAVIYSSLLEVPNVAWLRLVFDQATLGRAPTGGEPTILRIVSLFDGAFQTLNATHVQQWRHTSAYFNGGRLLVEIVADPGAEPSRVLITRVFASASGPMLPESICGPSDDRVLSNDPRVARFYPGRCSIFIIDDPNHCLLTAGHCASYLNIVEFNCPLSNSSGTPQHPGPEDQYAYDPVSVQSYYGGIGNDWTYFGCFPNSTTGLTPYQAQGDCFVVALPPPVSGQEIRITGYGVTSPPVPPEWNRAQKTHVGPYFDFSGTTVRYRVDTTSGNSGSPVIFESTGEVIGIHTHGGCSGSSGSNAGTGNNNPGLQDALAKPCGVCVPIYKPGDMNCDGKVDFDDIDPFVLALSGQAAYYAVWPDCNWLNGDINGDGTVNFDDIDPFVALLGG